LTYAANGRKRRDLAVGARQVEGRLSPPFAAIGCPNPKGLREGGTRREIDDGLAQALCSVGAPATDDPPATELLTKDGA